MILARSVAVEVLDGLAADDPAAIRSRRDLQRVHRAMASRRIVQRALRAFKSLPRQASPLQILELGAGDGSLMLGVARALAPAWPPVALTLLDARAVVDARTLASYAELGWTARASVLDVFAWAGAASDPLLEGSAIGHWDLIVSNLFLHHFQGQQLAALFAAIKARSARLLACEPRRSWRALTGSHLLGALGVSALTRADAVLSVHAGFRGQEISALWPKPASEWQLQEYPAGLFTHCFRAQRVEAA